MKLLPHQLDVLEQTKDCDHVAYYLDMGLGKTFVGAEKLKQIGNEVNLVICQKSKIKDWLDHFKQYYDCLTLDLTNKADFQTFINESDRRVNDVVGIINYELAWRRKYLLTLTDFTLMLDESSLISNHTAKQTKFVMKLKPQAVILLSGTPTSGKYERLWTQAKLLGWNIKHTVYDNTYINYESVAIGGVHYRQVSKTEPYKNVDRLKRKFREHGAVFLKTEEVLNLPKQIVSLVKVDTTPMYKKFIKNDYVMVDTKNLCEFKDDSDYYGTDITPRTELIATTALTKRLYARQLASEFNPHKIKALKDLIESTDERLVVFYNFNSELEQMKRICKAQNRPVSEVNGHCKDLRSYEAYDDSVTFVQYQAGAMGINLQKANKIIYFSLPERSELFEQSKKRIHRLGQNKPCFYYVLLADGTVDWMIYKALKMRKDFTDELFRSGLSG